MTKTVMITGDNKLTAAAIAAEIGAVHIAAELGDGAGLVSELLQRRRALFGVEAGLLVALLEVEQRRVAQQLVRRIRARQQRHDDPHDADDQAERTGMECRRRHFRSLFEDPVPDFCRVILVMLDYRRDNLRKYFW